MKWQGRRGSRNIQDRRGRGTASVGGIGIVGILAIFLIGKFLGVDVSPLLNEVGAGQISAGGTETITAEDQRAGEFVSVTLADTEEVWAEIFRSQVGQAYVPPTLVLFKGETQSRCGGANAATGPFYCPGDKQIYLDTDFFVTLERQLGARGDFASAYVVAHEVAHAVQDQLGILGQANQMRAQVSESESNAISVRIELQADCFAGVWARQVQDTLNTLERGDVAEAMNAAERIGDDTLQRGAGQRVRPDSFTHGTSAQRQRWFARGMDSGDLGECNTFQSDRL